MSYFHKEFASRSARVKEMKRLQVEAKLIREDRARMLDRIKFIKGQRGSWGEQTGLIAKRKKLMTQLREIRREVEKLRAFNRESNESRARHKTD